MLENPLYKGFLDFWWNSGFRECIKGCHLTAQLSTINDKNLYIYIKAQLVLPVFIYIYIYKGFPLYKWRLSVKWSIIYKGNLYIKDAKINPL